MSDASRVEGLIGDQDRSDLTSQRGRTWDAFIDDPATLSFRCATWAPPCMATLSITFSTLSV